MLLAVLHALLVRTSFLMDSRGVRGRCWRFAQRWTNARFGERTVSTTLHGHAAQINFANPYPYFQRSIRNYNAPQVEAVLLAAEDMGRPVRVVDVGAAIGDTALLLLQTCSPQLERIDCIEGEPRFQELLRRNLRGTVGVAHATMLSDSAGLVPSLVRTQHEGTASAVGGDSVPAVRLDSLIHDTDVIKVDTDGYDGTVLAGSTSLLNSHPIVLFEWHPLMCHHVGTDWRRAFQVLDQAGYNRYVLFTKFGEFSQILYGYDEVALGQLAKLCLESKTLYDWHFDVMALVGHDEKLISIAGLERWAVASKS